jgi:hypothetical protein
MKEIARNIRVIVDDLIGNSLLLVESILLVFKKGARILAP